MKRDEYREREGKDEKEKNRSACYLEQIIYTLVGVGLDQIDHSLGTKSVCMQIVSVERTYWRHDRLAICILYVAKGHFRAFVVIDVDFGKVVVGDLFQRSYLVSRYKVLWKGVLLFSCETIRVTRTAVSVVICLGPNRRPA